MAFFARLARLFNLPSLYSIIVVRVSGPICLSSFYLRRDRIIPKPKPGQIIYFTKGHCIAWGGTAVVERLPCDFQKDHYRDMRLEARIYQQIGEQPCLPRMINWDADTCCLTLEFLENGDLQEYIRQHHQSLTPELRIQWAKQAVQGPAALHCSGVLQCDISPRNFLLDVDLNLKISDFGGTSLFGSEPSAVAKTRFRHADFNWDVPPTFADDIFSLGSFLYFIMTGNYPYPEQTSDEVEKLYTEQDFPDLTHVTCGSIISQCWARKESVVDICDLIQVVEKIHV
ncbi:kinase-like protein [Aspergillus californicus]